VLIRGVVEVCTGVVMLGVAGISALGALWEVAGVACVVGGAVSVTVLTAGLAVFIF
jgi:hypothetical protein